MEGKPPPPPPRGGRRSADRLNLGSSSSNPQPQPQPQRQERAQIRVAPGMNYEKGYFDFYKSLGVHEEMLKDQVRNDAYQNAILYHRELIEGKVVLDVGCGTGFLAILCAQAGAKRVYAVEASGISEQAKNVVDENNLSETITVMHGLVEEVDIGEKVDVIISEWMGYMLLYEGMLGSIIVARDRWLKPGGLILPSNATLYIAPFTHPKRYRDSIDFWHNVHGIDMSVLIPTAKQSAFEEPQVETIPKENILNWPHVVRYINCYTVTLPELECITSTFTFNSSIRAPLHGFAFWFDVGFTGHATSPLPVTYGSPSSKRKNLADALILSTAPEELPTHWQQTLIFFQDPIEVETDQLIEGSVTLSQNEVHPRYMDIHLYYEYCGHSLAKFTVFK